MALVMRLILGLVGLDRGVTAAQIVPLVPPQSNQGSFSLDFNDDFDVGTGP